MGLLDRLPDDPPRAVRLALLGPAAALLVGDVWHDLAGGGGVAHVAGELGALSLLGIAFGWAQRGAARRAAARIAALEADLQAQRRRWEAAAAAPAVVAPAVVAPAVVAPEPVAPVAPFAARVDARFAAWGLSPAEQEVAWLLVKGVPIAEIGAVRHTSPRTARDQSRAVYAKAGVAGRAELAALVLDEASDAGGPGPQ